MQTGLQGVTGRGLCQVLSGSHLRVTIQHEKALGKYWMELDLSEGGESYFNPEQLCP